MIKYFYPFRKLFVNIKKGEIVSPRFLGQAAFEEYSALFPPRLNIWEIRFDSLPNQNGTHLEGMPLFYRYPLESHLVPLLPCKGTICPTHLLTSKGIYLLQ